LIAGSRYYLSTTAGAITNVAPSANIKAVLIAASTTTGYVQQYAVSASSQALTYGRVKALADLASINYAITSPGTAVNFDSTLYASGITFSGTNGLTPSVAGRYRASFLAMAGSGEFNGDGTFHIVQNGVSVGSIFVDIMQAAGVNQLSPFIDVDLAAGQAVTLNYQPVVADAVPWGRGSYFQLTQIAGFLPSVPTTGTTVDYVSAYRTSISSSINTAIDVPFSAAIGNIASTPASGTFDLTAGKTYELEGALSLQGLTGATDGGYITYGWVDTSNNLLATGQGSAQIQIDAVTTAKIFAGQQTAKIIYTPSVNQTVKFRIFTPAGVTSFALYGSGTGQAGTYAIIKQLGSTSNTVGTLPANDQSATGYFDIGNMRMQWGTHNDGNVDTTTVTFPAPFANTNYAVNATSNTSAGSLCTEAKTTTTFDIDRASTTVTTQLYSWFAIGLKP
jgi:hypothetical protein